MYNAIYLYNAHTIAVSVIIYDCVQARQNVVFVQSDIGSKFVFMKVVTICNTFFTINQHMKKVKRNVLKNSDIVNMRGGRRSSENWPGQVFNMSPC